MQRKLLVKRTDKVYSLLGRYIISTGNSHRHAFIFRAKQSKNNLKFLTLSAAT